MTYALDHSEKVKIGGPIDAGDGEIFYKYRAVSDGRTFWAINGMEVWYPGERLYWALDEIDRIKSQ